MIFDKFNQYIKTLDKVKWGMGCVLDAKNSQFIGEIDPIIKQINLNDEWDRYKNFNSKEIKKYEIFNSKGYRIAYFKVKIHSKFWEIQEAWTETFYQRNGLCRYLFDHLKQIAQVSSTPPNSICCFANEFKEVWLKMGFKEGIFHDRYNLQFNML